MFAAQTDNERAGKAVQSVFGCVTKGDGWQFLRLDETIVTIDRTLRFITDIGGILAVLRECVMTGKSVPASLTD